MIGRHSARHTSCFPTSRGWHAQQLMDVMCSDYKLRHAGKRMPEVGSLYRMEKDIGVLASTRIDFRGIPVIW